MNIQTKPLSEVTQQALALSTKELGIADTIQGHGAAALKRAAHAWP